MKVRFSKLASYKLEKLSEYLIEEWSESSNLKFLNQLDAKIQVIRSNPRSFPESDLQPGLRRCVVTKQTSLFNEIQSEIIFVLSIIDTRQSQDKLKEEVRRYFARHRQ